MTDDQPELPECDWHCWECDGDFATTREFLDHECES